MSGYTAPLKELLKQAGCYFVRKGRGDHEIWQSPKSKILMSVATNNAVILRRERSEPRRMEAGSVHVAILRDGRFAASSG